MLTPVVEVDGSTVEVNGVVLDLMHCELPEEIDRPQGLSEEDKSILTTIRQGYLPAPTLNRPATMLMEMIDDDEWVCNSEDEGEKKIKKTEITKDSELDSSVIISDEEEENEDDRKPSLSRNSDGRSSVHVNIVLSKATTTPVPTTMPESRRRSLGTNISSPTKTTSRMRTQEFSYSATTTFTQQHSAISVPQARHSVSVTSHLAREQQLLRERRTMPVSRTAMDVRGRGGNMTSNSTISNSNSNSNAIPLSPTHSSRTISNSNSNSNSNTIPLSPPIPSRPSLPSFPKQSSSSPPLPGNTNRHAAIMNMLTTRKSILQSLKKAKDYWTILEQVTDSLFLATCIDLIGKRLQPQNERERNIVRMLIKRCFESKREK